MKTKYYVHIYGPDDMEPAATWLEALEEANRYNAYFLKLLDKRTENDAIMYAVAEKVEKDNDQ